MINRPPSQRIQSEHGNLHGIDAGRTMKRYEDDRDRENDHRSS